MSGRLEGKTAIVTGSTKGIGLGIARAYVREGARVVVNSRSAADCASVARELGSAAVAVAADLSRSDEVRRLAKESRAALDGTVDILVNNAGQPRVAEKEQHQPCVYGGIQRPRDLCHLDPSRRPSPLQGEGNCEHRDRDHEEVRRRAPETDHAELDDLYVDQIEDRQQTDPRPCKVKGAESSCPQQGADPEPHDLRGRRGQRRPRDQRVRARQHGLAVDRARDRARGHDAREMKQSQVDRHAHSSHAERDGRELSSSH